MSVWLAYFLPVYFLPTYFTIQLIFTAIHESHYNFDTIYESHYTILTNFYLYLQYFQQKIFSFSKIDGSQTDPRNYINDYEKLNCYLTNHFFRSSANVVNVFLSCDILLLKWV